MKNSPLNNIKIASPCSANWDAMLGDDKKRFCGECKLNVYNLSGMSQRDAENLLIESEGRLCVRFYRRNDGTILTEDCPVGWAKVKKNISRLATATISLIIGLFAGLFAFNFSSKPTKTHTMGDIAPANTKVKIETDKDSCPPSTMGTPLPIREEKGGALMGNFSIEPKPEKKRNR
jgi:hypothetical protein